MPVMHPYPLSRLAILPAVLASALLAAACAPIAPQQSSATPPSNSALTRTPEQRAIQDSWGERGSWISPALGFSGFQSEEEYLDPDFPERNRPPLTPEARAFRTKVRKSLGEGVAIYNPTADCFPSGVPYLLAEPVSFELQFSNNRAMMLYEKQEFRLIYMDGREHPADFEPSFHGHSIGHWEGSTLVIDTVGIHGRNMQIEPHIKFTGAMHVTERWTPDGPDSIKVDVTISDPGTLTAPWQVTKTMKRDRDYELIEAICMENNRNPTDHHGRTMILGPDGRPLQDQQP